jgi:hypothetical protein
MVGHSKSLPVIARLVYNRYSRFHAIRRCATGRLQGDIPWKFTLGSRHTGLPRRPGETLCAELQPDSPTTNPVSGFSTSRWLTVTASLPNSLCGRQHSTRSLMILPQDLRGIFGTLTTTWICGLLFQNARPSHAAGVARQRQTLPVTHSIMGHRLSVAPQRKHCDQRTVHRHTYWHV